MGHAIMKIEGTLPAEPKNVYQFLRLSTKDGGKVSEVKLMCSAHNFSLVRLLVQE